MGEIRTTTAELAAIAGLLGSMLAAIASPAHAASFDCTKAATDQERLICSDKALSDADSQVAQLYKTALSQLSPTGGALLRRSQRDWLAYIRKACLLDAPAATSDKQDCLESEYGERVDELQKAVFRAGPYLFVRVTSYAVEQPAGDAEDDQNAQAGRRFGRDFAAYPRIDSPSTPATSSWNKGKENSTSRSTCEDVAGDGDVDYSINLATQRLISVTWTDWSYCEGAAHGNGDNRVDNMILAPMPHRLKATDLFKRNTPWRRSLTLLVLNALKRTEHYDLDEAAAAEIAVTPDRWTLKPEGLCIQFDSYEIGNGYGAPRVTIPWSALKDILAIDPTQP
jgi:uncharacterized protein